MLCDFLIIFESKICHAMLGANIIMSLFSRHVCMWVCLVMSHVNIAISCQFSVVFESNFTCCICSSCDNAFCIRTCTPKLQLRVKQRNFFLLGERSRSLIPLPWKIAKREPKFKPVNILSWTYLSLKVQPNKLWVN